MYELIQLTEHSYYIESPAKIGLVTLNAQDVVLIDSGNDKDAGKKVKRHLDANGWQLKAIFNTHSHADHIGGNRYLQAQTGCAVYATDTESAFTRHPVLEPTFLYGSNPPPELRHKFLMAEPSDAARLTADILPDGMQLLPLAGHSFDMVGFRTVDDVVYLADCLSSTVTLNKYKLSFLTDVAAYLDTLETVKTMRAAWFVPAHAAATEDIVPLAQQNIDCVHAIGDHITALCTTPHTTEDLLAQLFSGFKLTMTFEQHALIGSTLKAYLTWLKNTGRIAGEITDNRLIWKRI